MPEVNCRYCKKKFDRDKEPFVQIPWGTKGKAFRYGHAQCYLDAFNDPNHEEKTVRKIWNPKTASTCFWCHKALDTTDDSVMPLPDLPDRWAHKECVQKHPENDLEVLTVYILKLFKSKDNFIPPGLMKQLSSYEQDYEFTYTGMLKSLKYWYEVKKHPIDTNRGVGIIPLIYKEAKEYYYALYLAQLQNDKIEDFTAYIPKDIEVKIQPPKKKAEKRNLFSFLDEDNINGEQ